MQFQVPQFIEHEAKIVGPFTLKQSLFTLIPAAAVFLLFFILPTTLWVILAILLLGGGLASAFLKVEGKPLPIIMMHFFRFSTSSKNYLWQKGKIRVKPGQQMEYGTPVDSQQEQPASSASTTIQMAQGSKLQSLSTKVETEK